MLKDVQSENTLAKSAKDIKMRLNMLNIKRDKKRAPKKKEKRTKPAYQEYLPQKKIDPLEGLSRIKTNIEDLYQLAQEDETKGGVIEQGLTKVKDILTSCCN